MSDDGLIGLRRLFVDRYQDFKQRLARQLGSADVADEVMHDTWLRLAQAEQVGIVQNAEKYIFRTALNAATDRRQKEKRHQAALDITNFLELPDERPTPEQVAVARSEFEVFKRFLAGLSARRRLIFLAARLHSVPYQEIANRMGVSRALVQKELVLAHRELTAIRKKNRG